MSVLNRLSKRRRTRLEQRAAREEAELAPHEEQPSTPETRANVDFITAVEAKMKMLSFFHIGHMAKECLLRGYDFGVWHIECVSKSNKLSVFSVGEANPDMQHIVGGVGIREKFGALSLTQAWQTNGYMGMIGLCTEAVGGIVHSILKATYGPRENAAAKVDLLTGMERSPFKTEMIIPVWKSPKFLGYVLMQPWEHFVVACRMEYNIDDHKLETHAFCVGYLDNETEYGLKLENFQNMRGSVFQRINNRWALALKANLFGEDEKKFIVGGQYKVNESTLLKARVSDDGIAGLVYQFKVNDNVEGNYYFGFDVNSPLKGDHKIGICWRFKG